MKKMAVRTSYALLDYIDVASSPLSAS